jgi:hypothetical protein
MLTKKLGIAASVALAVLSAVVLPTSAQRSLVEGFKETPDRARPRVYWYWMNGNIEGGLA